MRRKLRWITCWGVITSFTGSNAKEVTLKARGQAITTAVELTKRRFMKGLSMGKITIGTEEMLPRQKAKQGWFQRSKSR